MKCTTCVVLAGALLCSTRTLSAQSAVPPTVAALAGCYALTLGPWQQQYAGGAASWQTLPPVIRLDTTLAWRVPGWRSLGPTPTQYTRYGPGISPAWRVSPTDSVEAFWSTGFVGTRFFDHPRSLWRPRDGFMTRIHPSTAGGRRGRCALC